jgi:hypothetical protein
MLKMLTRGSMLGYQPFAGGRFRLAEALNVAPALSRRNSL